MTKKQRTIKRPVSLQGRGIHTGNDTKITFKPAPPNYGRVFVRVDLEEKPEIPALVEYVIQNDKIDSSRGTSLQKGDVQVHTVEHVLAALVGLEIDNVIIELNANEPPIVDGSAMPFVNKLLEAGIEEQDVDKEYLVIEEPVNFKNERRGVEFVALPTDAYRITLMIDYKNPALGSQHTGLFSLEEEFITEFAPARTFCFLHEIEALADQGLIKGGDIDSAVVIVDRPLNKEEIERLKKKLGVDDDVELGASGILNNKALRFHNEPARHKLLDLIGDLALTGVNIKSQILAARPGHQSNIEFARILRNIYKKQKLTRKFQDISKKGIVFDIDAIKKILPHRYPFLLVDAIIELEPEKRAVGIKNVTVNEPFFQGHFPQRPVMPGVLIVEAMAQVGGILLLNERVDVENKLVYFMGMDNVRFRKVVQPGDQLVMELEMLKNRRTTFKMAGKAYVRGELVCEAEMMAAVVDN
ncbi:bifunctional UDP-3-O-[3-hydroxymyristoyl] N-acetylglucosamine deacetylase/3-hydroxyacyl-ACP dehydratase [Caldithrix abyssi]|uniref:Multifunctional fusion protein n=1 Tax=Caldithrix abyssi DSM 13497 TaxID=880073 RepID=H1XNM4_CALAY|nr:bifunctional UDP-3-O-[3-hydroxymyristoyl] N-acetylglucosamine deacetylase/3-hydroxyacyl-ACP dehydratase [Caldithrix abyssi]APF19360.1 3-hydroxyacyl-(acyl-carrier-protein) dehydratase /UDP-3-O-(3-hydroxymyristoyl) N-acetylglucosamine deacetylase [Caldithrix abyssi DSM 13497]EHO43262.1 UDP-3-O-(3-hydroxymyristoyl) N-acetylglucosamine deacetylase [Caldithrix abyssi DSM 13497]